VAALRATANPKAATVTGNVNPRTGLDAKFSLTHGVAVALTAPTPQLTHFTDAAAVDPSRRQQHGHPRHRGLPGVAGGRDVTGHLIEVGAAR
jgi:hypothetical protein